jgi:hypothetical protein
MLSPEYQIQRQFRRIGISGQLNNKSGFVLPICFVKINIKIFFMTACKSTLGAVRMLNRST